MSNLAWIFGNLNFRLPQNYCLPHCKKYSRIVRSQSQTHGEIFYPSSSILLNHRSLLVSNRRPLDKAEMYEHLAQSYENVVVHYQELRSTLSTILQFLATKTQQPPRFWSQIATKISMQDISVADISAEDISAEDFSAEDIFQGGSSMGVYNKYISYIPLGSSTEISFAETSSTEISSKELYVW